MLREASDGWRDPGQKDVGICSAPSSHLHKSHISRINTMNSGDSAQLAGPKRFAVHCVGDWNIARSGSRPDRVAPLRLVVGSRQSNLFRRRFFSVRRRLENAVIDEVVS
ncbi:hypothetical protein NL676_016747 [Syzygium grande]|nr:hypothetical protein NL676_016747 [Syzygium grande]